MIFVVIFLCCDNL